MIPFTESVVQSIELSNSKTKNIFRREDVRGELRPFYFATRTITESFLEDVYKKVFVTITVDYKIIIDNKTIHYLFKEYYNVNSPENKIFFPASKFSLGKNFKNITIIVKTDTDTEFGFNFCI
jgi:hypothetical protein